MILEETVIFPTLTPETPNPTSAFLNVNIYPILTERIDGIYDNFCTIRADIPCYDTSTGMDTINFFLGVENSTDDTVFIKSPINANLLTAEGYEYYCSVDLRGGGFDTDEIIITSKFRILLSLIKCEIPELTTGHKLEITYFIAKVDPSDLRYDLGIFPAEEKVIEILFDNTSKNTPALGLIESVNIETYRPNKTNLYKSGEIIKIGDIDTAFALTQDGQLKVNIKNNFIGGSTSFSLSGFFFMPGMDYGNEGTIQAEIGPAQEIECITANIWDYWDRDKNGCWEIMSFGYSDTSPITPPNIITNNLPLVPPPGSCFYWLWTESKNSQGTYKSQNQELICFK
ncbi:MAG: hypothetical protein KF758_15695 [Anaerolineales bacterium]|nr:hypothetical protein [Anaerolineales bacterium]